MAARHDKDYAPAYYGIAYVYSTQGKLDDAIANYRQTLKRDKTYVFTYANLGYALLQKEQFEEALQMLDKALELDPKCGEAHLSYANYYAYKQDWKKAEQSINKAIEYGQKVHPELRKMLEHHRMDCDSNGPVLILAGKASLTWIASPSFLNFDWPQYTVGKAHGESSYQWRKLVFRDITMYQVPHFSRANSHKRLEECARWLASELGLAIFD